MRKERLGVVLAGGLSLSTRCINVKQNALAVVKWEGETVPLVVHQARMLSHYVDDVVVAVGWQGEDVRTVLSLYKVKCLVFNTPNIDGIVWTWRKILLKHPEYSSMISVNCDNLHNNSIYRMLDSYGFTEDGQGKETGIYYLSTRDISDTNWAMVEQGSLPDTIFEQMVDRGINLKVYSVNEWVDMGDPATLKRKMVGYGINY